MTAVPPQFTDSLPVRSVLVTVEAVAGYADLCSPSPAPSKPQCPRRPPPDFHCLRLAGGDLAISMLLIGVLI